MTHHHHWTVHLKRRDSNRRSGVFESFLEDQVSVMTFENALNLLLLCSLRREGTTR
jgi:hypothetical protein